MDSDNVTFNDLGLTPQYVKTALEDLANDQMVTEDAVARLNKQMVLTGVVAVGGLGVAMLALKVTKKMMDAIGQLGGAVMTTQQAVGLIPSEPVQEPVGEKVVPLRKEPEGQVATIGEGFDPGPQPGPDGPLPEVPAVDEGDGIR